ncbi:MAG TPA: class I SAM-dependent methyltransferase [Pyrinomonadaceae bacterium]|nr:class I SAM-dependent methyltransferase [Pyrinomonadaceae bacterium]
MPKSFRSILATPPDPFLVTPRSVQRVSVLVESAGSASIIFNVGAGYTSLGERVVNIDIFDSGTTDIIASAMALPFPDGCADLVILQGVLEHVEDAAGTLAEAIRVLKPGGLFYTEMPFMQPYHESPIDLRRSTKSGLATLCQPLIEIESGIHIGPAATFAWFLREFWARLLSGGRPSVYAKGSTLIGWIVFPLRYADRFLEKIPHLHTVASSCYYLGRKAQS